MCPGASLAQTRVSKIKLDPINKKLMLRKFGKAGGASRAPKKPPRWYLGELVGLSKSEINIVHLNEMRQTLA